MARRLLFSLLLALTFVAGASTTSTTMISSTAAGSTPSATMMSSTSAVSIPSTTMMSSTSAGSNPSTTMMSSTAAGSTASTAMMSSTAAGSTGSTAAMSSTSVGPSPITTMMSSTAAGSTSVTVVASSTAPGSTSITGVVSSTAAGSTADTAAVSSTAAGTTADTAAVSSTAAGTTADTAAVSSTAAATTGDGATAVSTNAPVLTPNTTVEVLSTTISNSSCGTSQLCVSEPSGCNPSESGSCVFIGAKQSSGQNFEFEISGESEGYIGCTLSPDITLGDNDTTYICANNNGTVKFIGSLLDNGALTEESVNANSVKGRIDGNRIQCTFSATVPDATARSLVTSFSVASVCGTYSASTGALGDPTTKLKTGVVNIANVTATTTNILTTDTTTTTATPTTTVVAGSRPTHQALSQALLIITGAMGLALL